MLSLGFIWCFDWEAKWYSRRQNKFAKKLQWSECLSAALFPWNRFCTLNLGSYSAAFYAVSQCSCNSHIISFTLNTNLEHMNKKRKLLIHLVDYFNCYLVSNNLNLSQRQAFRNKINIKNLLRISKIVKRTLALITT